MKILFMGTPGFAEESLKALCEASADKHFEVVGVVTQPDKPVGRKQILTPSPVKIYAEKHLLNVYQPHTLRDDAFASLLGGLAPDVIVVAAYGKIIPKNVLDFPKLGCINVHGSLLPEYRGAAPIQRAILDGKNETGVTTMYMNEGIDTGDILLSTKTAIQPDENFASLYGRLAVIGAALLIETLKKSEEGSLVRIKQNDSLATYASKIEKDDERLLPDSTVAEALCRIRALSPEPGAYLFLGEKVLKIYSAHLNESEKGNGFVSGDVVRLSKNSITVKFRDGCADITELQLEGGKRLAARDFIAGRKIEQGNRLF